LRLFVLGVRIDSLSAPGHRLPSPEQDPRAAALPRSDARCARGIAWRICGRRRRCARAVKLTTARASQRPYKGCSLCKYLPAFTSLHSTGYATRAIKHPRGATSRIVQHRDCVNKRGKATHAHHHSCVPVGILLISGGRTRIPGMEGSTHIDPSIAPITMQPDHHGRSGR
jgi:hypothetical protein